MFPTCKLFNVGIIPWSPIARGALARPVASEPTVRVGADPFVIFSFPRRFTKYLEANHHPLFVRRLSSLQQLQGTWTRQARRRHPGHHQRVSTSSFSCFSLSLSPSITSNLTERYLSLHVFSLSHSVEKIAKARNISMAQVAVAWSLAFVLSFFPPQSIPTSHLTHTSYRSFFTAPPE